MIDDIFTIQKESNRIALSINGIFMFRAKSTGHLGQWIQKHYPKPDNAKWIYVPTVLDELFQQHPEGSAISFHGNALWFCNTDERPLDDELVAQIEFEQWCDEIGWTQI